MQRINLVETPIAELRTALETGRVTSENLTRAYLSRIATYDSAGPRLNAVPILNPAALEDALAAGARRAAGKVLGPLDGIPYTAKASFSAQGLPVSAGSPAFADLIAQQDAFAISQLRAAGAILLGLTNMPPMANGGMQRGVYGRAESPYNAAYLTAAFASGSSNGSGTATAASFAAFGLGEETWSSGRAPAANNGLCAYTPSRGVISVRGNWPLVPTMDVVVPHARCMADLLEVLDVIVADDAETRGDLWRTSSIRFFFFIIKTIYFINFQFLPVAVTIFSFFYRRAARVGGHPQGVRHPSLVLSRIGPRRRAPPPRNTSRHTSHVH
jgi:amidase